jgi:hypothetical protein
MNGARLCAKSALLPLAKNSNRNKTAFGRMIMVVMRHRRHVVGIK